MALGWPRANMIMGAEDDHAYRLFGRKTIERYRDTRDCLRQAGASLPVHSRAVSGESFSGKRTGRVPKMIIGSGTPLPEKWRRCAKMIMAAKGDHTKWYVAGERFGSALPSRHASE